MDLFMIFVIALVGMFLFSAINILKEYERGVIFFRLPLQEVNFI